MDELKIIKATYYVPEIGVERGTDVTTELLAKTRDGRLFYDGLYNNIFPDNFVGKRKRLKVEVEYAGKRLPQFYNENEKINLPNDLGEIKRKSVDFNNPWIITIVGGVIVGIILWFLLKDKF